MKQQTPNKIKHQESSKQAKKIATKIARLSLKSLGAKKLGPINYKDARETLRLWFLAYTGCFIQEDINGKEWPCGTCTIDLLNKIGLKSAKKEYNKHNRPVDRSNEVWRAILQIRNTKVKK